MCIQPYRLKHHLLASVCVCVFYDVVIHLQYVHPCVFNVILCAPFPGIYLTNKLLYFVDFDASHCCIDLQLCFSRV